MKLLIISHTAHYEVKGQVMGWGPTIREIDHLATLFSQVEHLAPLHSGPAPDSVLPYTQNNIRFKAVQPAGGESFWAKMGVLWHIPQWLYKLRKALRKTEVIHVRCPAGISLIALLAVRLWGRGKPCWVKYAGNWQPEGYEPWSYWLQRSLLLRNIHHGVVTINGNWEKQPAHIFSFINPSMTLKEYDNANKSAQFKFMNKPVELLFVGRIEHAKGVGRLLEIASVLKEMKLLFNMTIIGNSPEKTAFEDFVKSQGLEDSVHFTGWLPISKVMSYYKQAHLFVLPSSASEGWPKVLSEAMAHGVVPIASTISSIPQTLALFDAGKAIPSEQVANYAAAIREYVEDPAVWKSESDNSTQAGVRYTYQAYLDDVKNMFQEAWQIDLIP